MDGIKYNYWKLRGFGVYGTSDLRECTGKLMDLNGCTVLLCTGGYAIVSVNSKQYRVSCGSLVLMPYDMSFIPIRTSSEFSVRYISVSKEIADNLFCTINVNVWDLIYTSPVLDTSAVQYELLCHWFDQAEWMLKTCDEEYQENVLKNSLYNLLIGVCSEVRRMGIKEMASDIKNRAWKLAGEFYALLNRYHAKHREVKFYADKMSITPDYLYKLIYRTDKITPKEVIDRNTIVTIKNYLQSTDLSVKSIADELNFEDASYMCRFFRKMTGMSPNQFRNKTNKRE